ncbi:MAG: S41 family peptidase [Caldilineaceae bacterium]|nr:S41 family peptidase [Caldilineaceae bacterium]MBP8108022.1 S41 family peptidase [Caldilineaceae bacterium]MBP8125064.1 S41 family peptidase [Caldilineaceae bacterium]MBP9071001.1 S41 family peptidase [Caldilineaceae bacterium]
MSLVVGSFLIGAVVQVGEGSVLAQDDRPSQFVVFWEAWDYVQEYFVDRDKIDPTQMTYGAIQGMLNTLGDQGHTTFMTAEEVLRHDEDLESSFEGIGAYVTFEENEIRIISPIHNSPAEAAGILAGDVVLAVDGEDIYGQTLNEVIGKIRGPANSTVILTVLHPGSEDPVDISIVRAQIQQESVTWTLAPDTLIAYVSISQFADRTGRELATALWDVRRTRVKGQPVEGIILDLRNNPGGYLREAIQVVSQFVPEGAVVLQEEDAEGRRIVHETRGRGWGRDLPIVVLINPGSASAAEITAGALQENDRAILLGETTFGTGTVLNQFSLSDGSALLLGVANWLTPDGRLIKGQGIQPDVEVIQPSSVRMVDSYALEEMTGPEMLASEDAQFLAGLAYMQEMLLSGDSASRPVAPDGATDQAAPTTRPRSDEFDTEPTKSQGVFLFGKG